MGREGALLVGVDFEEDTVDEEIVIALPDDGGMICFGAGVTGFFDFSGDDGCLLMITSS
jgi:hypothetical protein